MDIQMMKMRISEKKATIISKKYLHMMFSKSYMNILLKIILKKILENLKNALLNII